MCHHLLYSTLPRQSAREVEFFVEKTSFVYIVYIYQSFITHPNIFGEINEIKRSHK